jgi:hypothetical protein
MSILMLSMFQISCPYSFAWVVHPKNPSRTEALCSFSERICFLWWGVVSLMPNPQAGGPPLVVCPRLLIQYIPS